MASASTKVFAIPELLEQILLELTNDDYIHLNAVVNEVLYPDLAEPVSPPS